MRQMVRRKMGLAKKSEHARLRMGAADLRDLGGGVAVTRGDLAHVAPRLQINAVDRAPVLARLAQQVSERLPVITPFIVIADAGTQFVFSDFAAQPFIQHILVAAESHLQRQHHWASTLGQWMDQ